MNITFKLYMAGAIVQCGWDDYYAHGQPGFIFGILYGTPSPPEVVSKC